jgi:hypothetical protein
MDWFINLQVLILFIFALGLLWLIHKYDLNTNSKETKSTELDKAKSAELNKSVNAALEARKDEYTKLVDRGYSYDAPLGLKNASEVKALESQYGNKISKFLTNDR